MVNNEYRVILSKLAIEKLQSIHDNYKDFDTANLAFKIKNGLLKESKKLKTFPSSKPKLRTKKQVIPPYRYAQKWSFKIIFQILASEATVLILDFIHDKENPVKWDSI